ncbi:histidinol-phosphate transaminase [Patescibacteria group bacterium]
MKNYAKPNIQNMQVYSPPLEGRRGMLQLDFNERTIPPNKLVTEALIDFFKDGNLQVYPEYGDLNKKIADYSKVREEQVMITNGSDQGIDLIFRVFTDKGDKVIIPTPSFAMFYQASEIAENNIVKPSYDEDLAFPLQKVLDEIDKETKLVVICNPNNPTGTNVELDDIKKVLEKAKANDALVYIDEAYYEFCGITGAGLINDYPNLIISRTFSKAFGLGSMRIGYLIADSELINEMLKVRGPYDVNQAAVVAARASLQPKVLEDVEDYRKEVMEVAKPMVEKYFDERGIEYFPSSANFVLFKTDDPTKIYEGLKENGILVRPRKGPNINGTIRVCIGTVEQMKKFMDIFDTLLPKKIAFLDRDGALIYEPPEEETKQGDVPYQIDSIDKLKILDGVIEGLKELRTKGYKLVMISNQDGMGTEIFPQKDFEAPQNEMLKIFEENGIKFDKIFVCPHLPEDNCGCRKPKTGLVDQFVTEENIDLESSFMYGDRDSDRKFAENIGIKFIKAETNKPFNLK